MRSCELVDVSRWEENCALLRVIRSRWEAGDESDIS